jgi:hypothetical protein
VSLPVALGPAEVDLAKALLMGLLAAVSGLAVQTGAAVYQDGLRTSIPELWQGGRDRRSLASFAWSLNIGFIVAYALPYSLATGIVIIHIILLSVDVIGLRFGDRRAAVTASFSFGIAASFGIDVIASLLGTVGAFEPSLGQLFAPIAYSFPLMAATAIGSVHGLRWGIGAAVATVGLWRGADLILHGGGLVGPLTTTGGAIALAIMTVALAVPALAHRAPPVMEDLGIDRAGTDRIRARWLLLVAPPVLIAIIASQGWLAGEPVQLVLLHVGDPLAAAVVALFSTLAFVPMIAMSGLLSGVWNQDGYPDWYLSAGYVSPNPLVAAFGGLVLVAVEILSLRSVGGFLNTHPQLHAAGSAARDALDTVPTYSVLAGGVAAAIGLAGPAGAATVVGAFILNDHAGRPVMPLAVPVFAFLGLVITVDLARLAGLVA